MLPADLSSVLGLPGVLILICISPLAQAIQLKAITNAC